MASGGVFPETLFLTVILSFSVPDSIKWRKFIINKIAKNDILIIKKKEAS